MVSFASSISIFLLSFIDGTSEAFQIIHPIKHATGSLFMSSIGYLDSLSSYSNHPEPASPPPVAPVETPTNDDASQGTLFYHAAISHFEISKLTPKGPRKNADVGTPHDSTRKLAAIGPTSSGSWWCASGGWPSPAQRGTTEIFFVLTGNGCLTDLDETKHYFGPGDTVVLPKGWSGRWDVLQDIHKVWFVHDHPNIEEKSSPIRALIIPYSALAGKHLQESYGQVKMTINGNPEIYSQIIYSVGPTKVGSWMCTPGSFSVDDLNTTIGFHVLEGVFFLTDSSSETGEARRCVAGDTVVLPKGWSGTFDVIDTAKKLWTTLDS